MNLQQTAKHHPLIAYPALVAAVLWVVLSALAVKSDLDFYGEINAVTFLSVLILLVLTLIVVYLAFLPGIIAWYRKHPSRVAVSWMCLLGWIPFIGWIFWIGLMFFAALSQTTRATPVAYGEGSVVNGHILLNGHWWPA